MQICQRKKCLSFCFLIYRMWLSGPALGVLEELMRNWMVSTLSLLVLSPVVSGPPPLSHGRQTSKSKVIPHRGSWILREIKPSQATAGRNSMLGKGIAVYRGRAAWGRGVPNRAVRQVVCSPPAGLPRYTGEP